MLHFFLLNRVKIFWKEKKIELTSMIYIYLQKKPKTPRWSLRCTTKLESQTPRHLQYKNIQTVTIVPGHLIKQRWGRTIRRLRRQSSIQWRFFSFPNCLTTFMNPFSPNGKRDVFFYWKNNFLSILIKNRRYYAELQWFSCDLLPPLHSLPLH